MVRRSLENHDHSSTGNGGRQIKPDIVEVANSLGIPVESADADADNERLYFHSSDKTIKYKDSAGNVFSGDVNNPLTANLDADGNNINNVGSLSTDKAAINDLSARLEKTTDQSISAYTDTTVNWDSQTLDTNLYTYNTSPNTLDVLEAGDYQVSFLTTFIGIDNDQSQTILKILVNGTKVSEAVRTTSGTNNQSVHVTKTLTNLSANDAIRTDVRTSESNTVFGGEAFTYCTVTRSG